MISRIESEIDFWIADVFAPYEKPSQEKYLLKIAAHLRSLVRVIDRTPQSVQDAYPGMSGTLRDLLNRSTEGQEEWQRLKEVRHFAKRRLERLEDYLKVQRRMAPRRGRPKNVRRHLLASHIAWVLRVNGVAVRTSRTGTFARVLQIVLFEVEGRAPDELFRLIQQAAQHVNQFSVEEMRASDELLGLRVRRTPSA